MSWQSWWDKNGATVGYSLPFGIGTFAQQVDYANEMKRWNDDFQKNVGRTIRYPNKTNTSMAVINARAAHAGINMAKQLSSAGLAGSKRTTRNFQDL